MKVPFLIVLAFVLLSVAGCSTSKPMLSPALVQAGVASCISYGTARYPAAVPYLRAAEPIICSASESTNLAPAQVVAALDAANVLRTPEAVFLANSALLLYTGVYNAFGADAVNNSAQLKEYLHATCLGIGEGVRPLPAILLAPSKRSQQWPQVR